MPTDLEQRLSAALHTVTPEPPSAFSFTPPTDIDDEPGELIDLHERQRPRSARIAPLLAAAAVVVIGGGVVAAVVATRGHSGTPAAGHSPTSRRSATSGPTTDPDPGFTGRCLADNLLLKLHGSAVVGGSARATVDYENTGSTACRLAALPTLALRPAGADAASVADLPFPTATSPTDLTLAPRTAFAFSLQLTSTGPCTVSTAGQSTGSDQQASVTVDTHDGFVQQLFLGVAGCTLRPNSITVSTVRD